MKRAPFPIRFFAFACVACCAFLASAATMAAEQVKVATFDIDVTPPLGYQMAYDPVIRVDELTLRCRGIVLLGDFQPIVLCSVDWIGIANEAHDAFRAALATAAGTIPDRVAVQTLHQHDSPYVDFTTERILRQAGATDLGPFDGRFAREVIVRAADAVKSSLERAVPVSHAGWGKADVVEVASNRRILGPDGKVKVTRFTATRDPAVRAEPEGTVDHEVNVVSFWNGDKPVAVLSYYATHPQSYYRTGIPSPDFPGIARFIRQQSVPSAVHIHFTGAGGNVGAGKYNDGSPDNRMALALRLADGMKRAFDSSAKKEVTSKDIQWSSSRVALPLAEHLQEAKYRPMLADAAKNPKAAVEAASKLAWFERCKSGHQIDITMLSLGDVRILNMPGELFVEYALAAKAMRPDLHVAMAAYGDDGPCYIGTAIAYEQGGYETSEGATNVAPSVEPILMNTLKSLLQVPETKAP